MPKVLGEILLRRGLIDAAQLEQASAHTQSTGSSFGKAVVELGFLSEPEILQALADQLGMGYVDVDQDAVDPMASVMITKRLAEELVAVPVRFNEHDELVVAVAEPTSADEVKQRVEAETGLPVRVALGARKAIIAAIRHVGDQPGGIGSALQSADMADWSAKSAGNGNGAAEEAPRAVRLVESEETPLINLDELLDELVTREGSDLHLTTGVPPTIRLNGELEPMAGYDRLEPVELRKMLYGIMTQKQREQFENNLELDMSYSLPGRARFRVNIFQQRDALGSVMRVIPFEIKSVEELGLPGKVADFAYVPRGFVAVTGTTGSGKSTTLAAIIDTINENRADHILTVEDPIEFLHRHKKSVVNQREVGSDTHGFANALKHALRQDPDVILVGELRDLETIQIALTAAETGHLVFGTLHTADAPQTVDRIIDVFPPHQQEQIRVQLAGALQGVISQQLLKTTDGSGRAVAAEIMVGTSAIKNLIREGKTHQIYSLIQAGAQHGMVSMDQSLADLVKSGKITYDAALNRCHDVNEFNRLSGRG